MPITALPEHLRDHDSTPIGDGTDGDNWIQRNIPRHWDAFGPNATEKIGWITIVPIPYWFGWKEFDFRVWRWMVTLELPVPTRWTRLVFPIPVPAKWRRFPVLIVGYDVRRWMGEKDKTRLKVHTLKKKFATTLWGRDTTQLVTIETRGDTTQPPTLMRTLDDHGPSPIQYWSPFSFQFTWPLHFAIQFQWRWSAVMQSYKRKIFLRVGWRWDSLDDYHQGPAFFLGLTFN